MKVQTSLSMPWLGATVAFLPALFVAFQDGAPQEAKATKEDPKHPTSSRLEAASLDAMFEAAWAADGVKPNSPADDAEWIRRASLTLNGCIPTAEEVAAFLGDHSRDKRAKKVDELLLRPEYGEHFGGEWELALVGRGARGQRFDRNAFGEWIIGEFNKNTPFNEFTKDVITASGTPEQNAAVGYMERWQGEPKDLAGQTAKAFLGIQIQCARCHDHKDQQWKQSDFNDFAAFYADVKVAPVGKKMDGKPPVMEVSDEPEKRSSGMFGRKNQKNMEARAKNAKNPEKVAKEIEKRALKTMPPSPLRPLSEGRSRSPSPRPRMSPTAPARPPRLRPSTPPSR